MNRFPWCANNAIGFLLVLGCACSSEQGGDLLEVELFSTTHVLDATALEALGPLGEDGVLQFKTQPAALEGIEPNHVILAPSSALVPQGLLRLVTAVKREDSGLRLSTVHAPLQLAFRKLHVKLRREVGSAGEDLEFERVGRREQAITFGEELWKSQSLDEYPFDGDDDHSTADDQVHVTGSLAAGFAYEFSLDVDWGDVSAIPAKVLECVKEVLKLSFDCSPEKFLPEVKVGFAIDGGAEAELKMEGVAFLGYEKEMVLAKKILKPFTVGPLAFVPRVEIVGKFSGGASSKFTLSSQASASFSTGIQYSSKSGGAFTPPDYTDNFAAPSVDTTLTAHSMVRVGPRFALRLYDLFGPYAGLYVGAELQADHSRDPCWELHGSLDVEYGFDIKIQDLPVVGTLELANIRDEVNVARKLITSGDCVPLPGGDKTGTAGEPDAASFADPTFTPWARAYSDVVDGHPYEGLGAQVEWTAITPTIDGRLVIAGSDATRLIKIDTDGQLVWARRYFAKGEVWTDTLLSELLPGKVVNTLDASMMLMAHPYTLLKVDAAGQLLWSRRFDAAYRETWLRFTDAVADGAGGVYLVGSWGKSASAALDADVWVLRVDANGQLLWSRRFGEPGWGEIPRAAVGTADGLVVVGSRWNESGARWQGIALRLDKDGELDWARTLVASACGAPDEQRLHLTHALRTREGDFVVAGSVEGSGYRLAVLKIKPDGELTWSATSGTDEAAQQLGPWLTSLVELPTSGYLATGVHVGKLNKREILLAGLDSVGRVLWAQTYGAEADPQTSLAADDSYPDLLLTRDGGALVAGYTNSLADAEHSMWAFKVPARDGEISFAALSGAHSTSRSLVDGDSCIEAATWNPDAQSQAATPVAIEITVESPQVSTTSLAP